MNLDEAQSARVREWIDQGMKVAEIQTRLADEFGVKLTYMEARLLLDDLKLRPKDAAPKAATPVLSATPSPSAPASPSATPGSAPAAPLKTSPLNPGAAGSGKVAVSLDEIARPGALVSGKVTFSDGETAGWQLDQYGRLGVIPKKAGYKPPQADMAEFQAELESVLSRMGF
ncbi:MAG: hypothetical protein JNK85_17760 [Verrucomicrobiales bacterium]|nr:hypothetical protein [Verrucomicrobiales bacterium]